MAGSHPRRFRGGRFAVAFAASALTFASGARAQSPLPLSGAPAGGAAQLAPDASPGITPDPMTMPGLACCPANRGELSFCETITESLFGDASAEGKWRPLTLGSFFSEGWREPWAGGPSGESGLTPRQGWLGAFEGVFYRLGLVNGTYQHDLNKPFGGDFYGSNFSAFLPLSRRFEVFFNAPYIATNGTEDPTRGYRTEFGDLQVAGSFLLSESAAFTQLFTLGATLPTGDAETGGHLTNLNPRYSFWSNPCGAWVVRGGTGVTIPLNDISGQTTLAADVAVGRYFRPHDVPFGDLVFYVNSNVAVPLEGGGRTSVGVGPGTRFQITGNWYYLNYIEFQVANEKPFDYQVQAAIVKAW